MPDLRFATSADEDKIIEFLRKNWKGNQTLVNSRRIFRYQYETFTECGFVLAEENGEIIGLKGYVPMNRTDNPDVAAAIALVVKNDHPMLNMEMQIFLEKGTNCRMMCSPGLNSGTAARIYPLFRYKVDSLKQYYMLSDREQFSVAKIINRPNKSPQGHAELKRFDGLKVMLQSFDPEKYRNLMPYKDADYLNYRYFSHPIYHYETYGIFKEQQSIATAVLFGREICVGDTKVFRIVDYIGAREDIREIGCSLKNLISERNWEYVDFCCYGLNDDDLFHAGFVLREKNDTNIIPHYFEPFEQRNVDIVFFSKQHKDVLICKADGDQDRPNCRKPEY